MAVPGDRLTTSFQENLLVLLCFSPTAAPIIRNSIPERLFGQQVYRDVVGRVYDYLDAHKAPPGDHLPDLFDEELEKDGSAAKQIGGLIDALYQQREIVSEPYVLSRLEQFVRLQTLKSSIIEASTAMQAGEIEAAEEALQEGLRQRLVTFTPGTTLSDGVRLVFADQIRAGVIPTGIKELDRWGLGPAKGELHLFVAPAKRGKTWWMVHLAKHGIQHRQRVVYVTLEINERQIAQRMVQCLFSVTRSKARVPITRIRTDELGRLLALEGDVRSPLSLDDKGTRPVLEKRMKRLYGRSSVFIKQFPAGSLTVSSLNGYLDMLERSSGFVPDMLIVDYPDLMKLSTDNYRIDLGSLYVKLRGIAVERDLALVCATQANREGAGAKTVLDRHAAEDWSKIGTADTILTYSQSNEERRMGLARIFASNSRVADRDRFSVLISQSYQIGQFALDSVMLDDNRYVSVLEQAAGAGVGNEADEAPE